MGRFLDVQSDIDDIATLSIIMQELQDGMKTLNNERFNGESSYLKNAILHIECASLDMKNFLRTREIS
jgi:hypothetical protein